MTEQEQQIALCEWIGWKLFRTVDGIDHYLNPESKGHTRSQLPNTNSLDVLHEMEKKLDVNQLTEYADLLDKVCVPVHICPLTHWQSVVMATSAQRRESLLRTLGLWKE